MLTWIGAYILAGLAWLGTHILAWLIPFLAQGFLLQVSVALTGEPAPRFGRAMKTALLASLLSAIAAGAWSFTFGLVIGGPVAFAVAGMLAIGVTTLVYRRQLGGSVLQSFMVAAIQYVLYTVVSLFTTTAFGWLF